MASLAERMKKVGSLATQFASDAPELSYGVGTPLPIPAINIAQRGDLNKGPVKGMKQICGDSGTFKTLIALMEGKAYVEYWRAKGEEAYIQLYSNEHGATLEYLVSLGINPDHILYKSFMGIEDLTFDAAQTFEELKTGDRIFTIVDSIGMAASAKEAEDLLTGDAKVDMTRAKKLNAFARVICPHLVPKELSLVIINHVYSDMGKYPKAIVGGGKKLYLASNEVWIMTARQLKEGDERAGFFFDINIDKSRFVRKWTKIPIGVSFERGILKHSGLLELAIESGHVLKFPGGYYARPNIDRILTPPKTKNKKKHTPKESDYYVKVRSKNTDNNDVFWEPIITDPTFNTYINNKFQLGGDLSAAEQVAGESFEAMDPEAQLDQLIEE